MFVEAVKKCEEAYQRLKGGEGSQVGVKECQPETKPAPMTPARVMLAKTHDITPSAVATSSGSGKFRAGVCDVTLPVLLGDHFDVEGGVGGGALQREALQLFMSPRSSPPLQDIPLDELEGLSATGPTEQHSILQRQAMQLGGSPSSPPPSSPPLGELDWLEGSGDQFLPTEQQGVAPPSTFAGGSSSLVGELERLAKLKGTLGLSDDEISQTTREVRLDFACRRANPALRITRARAWSGM